jgi:hypothetical protein
LWGVQARRDLRFDLQRRLPLRCIALFQLPE